MNNMTQFPIESLNLQMLNVGFAKHNGDWNWKNVVSPFTRFFYVTEGDAKLVFSDKTVTLKPHHMYIVPPYVQHSYECQGFFSLYYLHVYERVKSESNVFELYTLPTEVKAEPIDALIFENFCKAHPEAKLPESNPQTYDNKIHFTNYVQRYNNFPLWRKMRLRGAMLLLFSRFMEGAVSKMWTNDERMRRVLSYIHDNLYNEMNLDKLAEVACVTKHYLIRLFDRELGMSPIQYINKKKIEKSQLLLFTENMPVKEVAFLMGFRDMSYFIRLFKHFVGVTPRAYKVQAM